LEDKRLERLKEKVLTGHYKQYRATSISNIQAENDCESLTWDEMVATLLRTMVNRENAVIEDDERIVFTRTTPHPINPVPKAFVEQENKMKKPLIGNRVHNICADWGMILQQGLSGREKATLEALEKYGQARDKKIFLDCVLDSLDSIRSLVGKYRACAKEKNRMDIYSMLSHVPESQPRSFHEALQSLRFFQAVLWMCGHNHVGFGRFDQYMWPYLQRDLEHHILSADTAYELLREFLIAVNRDTDVYPGIQQGDNGQTLIVGGVTSSGESADNLLTRLVLQAACELALPDPKINLRIHSDTSDDIMQLAGKLVQRGLGFPQVSNDDVVIPALIAHGYAPQDARNYVVAACWEFIIPGKGIDVPNINALSFPAEADNAIRDGLAKNLTFGDILQNTRRNIEKRVSQYINNKSQLSYWPPSPLYSAYMTDCVEKGLDVNNGGAIYQNYGIHGAGSAHAADALCAIRENVYRKKVVSPWEYLSALQNNWEGAEELRGKIIRDCPHVGNNDDLADELLVILFSFFADACEKVTKKAQKSGRPVVVRPGSGSAMFYLWLTKKLRDNQIEPVVEATAEGRKTGDPISANLSPSMGIKTKGPISCLLSFSKIDYRRIYNGGPITLDLMPQTFQGKKGLAQIVNIIKTFYVTGCQQLQINMVSVDDLREAQKNPKRYSNLVVRVWGWSAYFCELDELFQEHLIRRQYYQ
jgi:formate C-acetyltransferase